jgi:hypothetical protein
MSAVNANAIFAGFDEVNIGPLMMLSQGDLVLQTSATVDNNRCARSLYDMVILSNVEFQLYSPNFINGTLAALPSLLSQAAMIGVVTRQASLTSWPGKDAFGWGYDPGTGNVYNNNAVIATLSTATYNDVIGVIVDPPNHTVQFTKNGVSMGSAISITASKSWFFAGMVSGVSGDIALKCNPGNTPFLYPMFQLSGWWVSRTAIGTMNLGTEPWMAAGTDTYPYEKYVGDINPIEQDMEISDSVLRFWPWGNSAPSELGAGGLVQMQVDDPNNDHDDLTADAARNDIAVLTRAQSDGTLATSEVIFTGIFDHCEQTARDKKQVYLRDQMSRLSIALRRALFGPGADPSVAGKPRPYSGGVARNYTPELYDPVALLYALHDMPITALGRVRVAGKQVFLNSDFTMVSDLQGLDFTTIETGKITVESTSYGGAFSGSLSDFFAGVANFGSVGTAGGGQTATSATSQTPGTGTKGFFVGAGLHFTTGSSVTVSSSGAPTATMTGTVSSYAGSTLNISVTSFTGSGAHTDWLITGGVNQPTGWACGGGYPTDYPTTLAQVGGSAPNKYVRFAQEADGIQWFYPLTNIVLAANHAYAIQANCAQVPYYGNTVDAQGSPSTSSPGYLVFGYLSDVRIQWFQIGKMQLLSTGGVNSWNNGPVTLSTVIQNNTGSAKNLVIGFLPNNVIQGTGGVSSYLDLKSIFANDVGAISDNVSLAGPGLTLFARDILVNHGPLDEAEFNSLDTDAIDKGGVLDSATLTATGYTYGLHVTSDETPTVGECLQQALDSVCSTCYVDENGKFRFARLYAPENATTVHGLLTATDVMGELQVYPDMAENLTTRISGCRNYSPYSASEFGDTSASDVPLVTRAQLMRDYQWTQTAGIQLAQRYNERYNQEPHKTLLDQVAHGLAEIIYVNGLYTVARNFYVGTFFEPFGRSYKLMQTWNLTYDLPTLKSGTNLIIVGRRRQPAKELCSLVLWGM